ncbi:unnamed protein product, partial [Allacma fusca]
MKVNMPKELQGEKYTIAILQALKYSSLEPIQKRFNQALQYCICKDKLPMNLVNGVGFQNLVHTMDPKIDIPSRSTVHRRLKKDFDSLVIPKMKKLLCTAYKGIISLDGWKSRRKDGILAFKYHFIDSEWKLRNVTLAIKSLNVSQTSDTIKQCYDDVIRQYGLGDK